LSELRRAAGQSLATVNQNFLHYLHKIPRNLYTADSGNLVYIESLARDLPNTAWTLSCDANYASFDLAKCMKISESLMDRKEALFGIRKETDLAVHPDNMLAPFTPTISDVNITENSHMQAAIDYLGQKLGGLALLVQKQSRHHSRDVSRMQCFNCGGSGHGVSTRTYRQI
jgi:hypothetical protein